MSQPDTHLHEQFESAEQQEYAATLGMWAFMATEFLLIGALFVAYTVYRIRWPEAFRRGSAEMHYWMGFFETGIILTTSFLVTLALRCAKLGQNNRVIVLLLTTVVMGAGFLTIKGSEYYLEWGEGLVPAISARFRQKKPISRPHSSIHVQCRSGCSCCSTTC